MRPGTAALLSLAAFAACASSDPSTAANIDAPISSEDVSITVRATSADDIPLSAITTTDLVARGRHWRVVTTHGAVHVWIPPGYTRRRAETVIYVHGFYTNVDGAWKDHFLASQFASSGINAVFIACEAPSGAGQPVSWTSLRSLLDAVTTGIQQKLPRRRIVAVGHSGAYRTLAQWLDEPLLDTVVLLDAAYGELDAFRRWVLQPRHRLIDVGDGTRQATDALHKTLPDSVIIDGFPSIEDEIPKDAARAKILYIRSNLGHFPLVTGGEAIPMLLRTLRAKKILDVPLADLIPTK
ncbi:hypothetical protein BH11MYX3_BH11MYX3_30570 [soil metagenome]